MTVTPADVAAVQTLPIRWCATHLSRCPIGAATMCMPAWSEIHTGGDPEVCRVVDATVTWTKDGEA